MLTRTLITDKGIIALLDSSSLCCPLSSLFLDVVKLPSNLSTLLSRNPYFTDIDIRTDETTDDLLAFLCLPNLIQLTLAAEYYEKVVSYSTPAILHPHLENLLFAWRVSPSLSLLLLRNKCRRRWWQRICCWIAFERGLVFVYSVYAYVRACLRVSDRSCVSFALVFLFFRWLFVIPCLLFCASFIFISLCLSFVFFHFVFLVPVFSCSGAHS